MPFWFVRFETEFLKQENRRTEEQENVKVEARRGLGSFLTEEQENLEQENVKSRGKCTRADKDLCVGLIFSLD